MRPRRDVFALGYIEKTVDVYQQQVERCSNGAASSVEHGDATTKWAGDVLDKYFEVTGEHPVIDRAHSQFRKIHKITSSRNGRVPYNRVPSQGISFEEVKELAIQRRSVRWYLPKPVPRDLIDKAVEVAALSPSACNRQPFEFRIYDDPQLVRKIVKVPMGTTGYAENVPVIVVIVGRQRAYFSERDRHLIYIDGALAAMSFMYALETVGLSSCPINWPDIKHRERRMADLLNLDLDERPVMLISVGYPDPTGKVAYSQKKPLDDIRSYNKL